MATIQATVNPRLLTKAARFFTGSVTGRIIEVLQNARRGGATHVEITNRDGVVTVSDNGRGIEDFAQLLDMGGSGWDDDTEASEDPAGVGLFCLAPRKVTIRSRGYMAVIEGGGWSGEPVAVADDPEPVEGTTLSFEDEQWSSDLVERQAVFSGLNVTVDGKDMESLPFVSNSANHHPKLGCRIEVRSSHELEVWHRTCMPDRYSSDEVLVNFHGQVVSFSNRPIEEQGVRYLVDLTGEPTGLRLMLPARTRMIKNEALEQLKAALEVEAFRFVHARGNHSLPYKQYVRAHELGFELPEATPTYRVGLLCGDTPEPVRVERSDDMPLSKCLRLDQDFPRDDGTEEDNVHLLAALGTLDEPFVPVDIRRCYDGYEWARLPTITAVDVTVGKTLKETWLWGEKLICVDGIRITVRTNDGRTITSPVCMAVGKPADSPAWTLRVYVTPEAEGRLQPSEIWHHFGGWSDGGDCFETQENQFTEQLEEFWARLLGPDEHIRRRIMAVVEDFDVRWSSVSINADGVVTLQLTGGGERTIRPPR